MWSMDGRYITIGRATPKALPNSHCDHRVGLLRSIA